MNEKTEPSPAEQNQQKPSRPVAGADTAGSASLTERQERGTLLRILDASLNRAREGLRTWEDYARFVLEDRGLTSRAKQLRHRLAESAGRLPRRDLLQARDTEGDCGTRLSTASEGTRATPLAVCVAAGERTQQALRSIEEYGKCLDRELARQAEAIRYECYSLAAALEGASSRRTALADARLYVLVDTLTSEESFDSHLRELIGAGVDVIQIRDKSCSDRLLLQRSRQAMEIVRELAGRHRALLIVNDRPDLAVAAGADGVHVGQDELPVQVVRRLVGSEMLIGVSTHSIDQAEAAVAEGADYIGCGPTFASQTKSFPAFAGPEFLRQVAASVSLPAFAIGGIDLKNLDQVIATGLRRVAVAGAIAAASSAAEAVAAFKKKL